MPKGIGYPGSKKKKKRNNFAEMGRIFEGPKGGQFTSSGRKKKEVE
jgi:hypothetical protein